MAFELKHVVPWGRNLDEYMRMFSLTDLDFKKLIISFGDGPASFNVEMTQLQRKVISLDPIYQFSQDELKQRISETKEIIIEQTRINQNQFIWSDIKSIESLEKIRTDAMLNLLMILNREKIKDDMYIMNCLIKQSIWIYRSI